MAKFEKISAFADADLAMPERKTEFSAGYDMAAAEDIIIPSYYEILGKMQEHCPFDAYPTLEEVANFTKMFKLKPTLIPTGMKCKLDPSTYLELSIRSSSPLKYWIMLANGIGVIDADYYNNPDNEGHIFFQVYNLTPFAIKIQKGEIIGQGIIKSYLLTEDDNAKGSRTGGFGSTTN